MELAWTDLLLLINHALSRLLSEDKGSQTISTCHCHVIRVTIVTIGIHI